MARTTIVVNEITTSYGGETEDITWTNGDDSNHHEFVNNGKELLLIFNDHDEALPVVVASVADKYGRTGDRTITTTHTKYSVAGPFPPHLWNTSTGVVEVNIADAGVGPGDNVIFAVIKFST